ncbi:GTPase IMAP family member 3-like [Oreochromis niloticus]|uniref:GTPase IMAP family member 6 n=1 Tax=Oreochromis niloticus TaxID=8128 RepID=I3JBU6_ORENI|nr:GTPase IMAP family member 3-like [Oreochromis niloticus]
MSSKRKIVVVILGRDEALKKALITNILGKDLSKLNKRQALKNTEIYVNDIYEVIFTPDLYAEFKDIQDLLCINRYPDMCLLVVEHGFSADDARKQIEHLSNKTEKPTEEFMVLLPLNCKRTDYPFRSCTMEQVFCELDRLAEGRNLMPAKTKMTDKPVPPLPAPRTEIAMAGKRTSIKVNLVLLGMSGTGKSASGNTILGKPVFFSRPSSKSVTRDCEIAETEINGKHVRVIDTPDMFDDETEESVKNKYLKRCKELCESHPCVFVLVMHISRFTDGERNILKQLEKAFGRNVKEQSVILFTKGDDLHRAGKTLTDVLHSCQPDLKEMIQQFGNRCVLFENNRSGSAQVEKLLDTVIMVLEKQQKL